MNRADPLEQNILSFSPHDHLTALDACESILITGAPGSGKTSTAGKQLMVSMMRSGFGFVVLSAKPDEAQTVINNAKEAGLNPDKDVILFNAESGMFDPLYYEYNRPGRGKNDVESVVDLLSAILTFGKPAASGSSEGRFFEEASNELSRMTITLCRLAGIPVSLINMYKIIASLPTAPGQYATPEYQAAAFTAKVFAGMADRKGDFTADDWDEAETCLDFVSDIWPNKDPRTTGNVISTWTGPISKFQFQPLKRLFCSGKCSFVWEHALHLAKTIIIDFPLNVYGIDSGRTIAGMMKLSFQRAALRRDVEKYPLPCTLFQDEGQMFLSPPAGGASRENAFLQVSRSARISTVFLTQSVSNIAEALGESSIGSKTKALLGNFGTRISFQSNDVDSNKLFADLIGKEWREIRGAQYGADKVSHSTTPQLVYILEPHEFTRLSKPDTQNPFATGVVYCGGRTFDITRTEATPDGRNFLLVQFSR